MRNRAIESRGTRPRPISYLLFIAPLLGLLFIGPRSADACQDDRTARAADSGGEPAALRLTPPSTPPFMRTGLTSVEDDAFRTAAFAIKATVADALSRLWEESVLVGEERVACLDGYIENGVFHITGSEPVPTEKADSIRVSPGPSLERCGPPNWRGTVHTHIALFNGRPFSTLSPSDRHVNGLWRAKWRTEGIFCVLYSESEAYCEYGHILNGDVPYSDEGVQVDRPLFRPRS